MLCEKFWIWFSNPDFSISIVSDKLPSETRDMKNDTGLEISKTENNFTPTKKT